MLGEIGQQSLISNLSDAIVGRLWPSSRFPHFGAGGSESEFLKP
jgi:hypothetical protein